MGPFFQFSFLLWGSYGPIWAQWFRKLMWRFIKGVSEPKAAETPAPKPKGRPKKQQLDPEPVDLLEAQVRQKGSLKRQFDQLSSQFDELKASLAKPQDSAIKISK